jgi:hypothetical protein
MEIGAVADFTVTTDLFSTGYVMGLHITMGGVMLELSDIGWS